MLLYGRRETPVDSSSLLRGEATQLSCGKNGSNLKNQTQKKSTSHPPKETANSSGREDHYTTGCSAAQQPAPPHSPGP